ncbi:MAG: fumarylacetoacetate hydrolase family protein [Planctomycetota bacterium]
MKIIRIQTDSGEIVLGRVRESGERTTLKGDLFGELRDTGEPLPEGRLLAPLDPVDILCIGLNYQKHAEEGGKPLPQHPVLFMKTTSALQHPGEPIVLPRKLASSKVDYECELAVVIGKPCKNVAAADALDYVLGYACGNDVSARDWQKHGGGGQWCRGKTFDTFAPIGPCLVTQGDAPDDIADPNTLRIRTVLNGRTMQDWNTGDMIFSVPRLIEFLSGSTTLMPGTVIFTGTPHGVGFARNPPVFLQEGDEVTVAIDGIGELTNPVIGEPGYAPPPSPAPTPAAAPQPQRGPEGPSGAAGYSMRELIMIGLGASILLGGLSALLRVDGRLMVSRDAFALMALPIAIVMGALLFFGFKGGVVGAVVGVGVFMLMFLSMT